MWIYGRTHAAVKYALEKGCWDSRLGKFWDALHQALARDIRCLYITSLCSSLYRWTSILVLAHACTCAVVASTFEGLVVACNGAASVLLNPWLHPSQPMAISCSIFIAHNSESSPSCRWTQKQIRTTERSTRGCLLRLLFGATLSHTRTTRPVLRQALQTSLWKQPVANVPDLAGAPADDIW